MTFGTRTDFWRTLAYDIEMTAEYPGYMYKFFRSFKEFDAYLSAEVDPDWRNTEWGKFLLKPETVEPEHISLSAVDVSAEDQVQSANSYTANKNNYEYIARELIRAGITDLDTLCSIIGQTCTKYQELVGSTEHTYKPSKTVLARYITKYGTRNQRPLKQTPKHIVLALIQFYAQQGLSLRDIAYKLNKNDGIRLSYERIRELINEADTIIPALQDR